MIENNDKHLWKSIFLVYFVILLCIVMYYIWLWLIDWLIDWFWRHICSSKVILCIEVRKSRSFKVHIYIFVHMFLKKLVCSILFFFVVFYLFIFWGSHRPIKYNRFLKRSIWPIDRTLKGTITLGQSGPGSNDSKGILHTPEIFRNRALALDGV